VSPAADTKGWPACSALFACLPPFSLPSPPISAAHMCSLHRMSALEAGVQSGRTCACAFAPPSRRGRVAQRESTAVLLQLGCIARAQCCKRTTVRGRWPTEGRWVVSIYRCLGYEPTAARKRQEQPANEVTTAATNVHGRKCFPTGGQSGRSCPQPSSVLRGQCGQRKQHLGFRRRDVDGYRRLRPREKRLGSW
jgi:hypothetical protein